jgi:hypothetical protein
VEDPRCAAAPATSRSPMRCTRSLIEHFEAGFAGERLVYRLPLDEPLVDTTAEKWCKQASAREGGRAHPSTCT